jgi:hypothetical protein
MPIRGLPPVCPGEGFIGLAGERGLTMKRKINNRRFGK